MPNQSNVSIHVANNNNQIELSNGKHNLLTLSNNQNFEETSSLKEFGRYLGINLIGIALIMFIMTFCYLTHVFYNNAWKPFKL